MKLITIKSVKSCVLSCLLALHFSAIATPLDLSDITVQGQIRQQERQLLLRQQQEIKPDARDGDRVPVSLRDVVSMESDPIDLFFP